MDIVFSVNNGEEVVILPIVPDDVEIQQTQANEEFSTINNGTLHLIGDLGLKNLSIKSFFPVKKYNWLKKGASSDGWSYVDFFIKNMKKRIPLRIIITTKSGREIVNMACLINQFSYAERRNGDISYSLEIKEFRFGEVK